VVWKTCDKHEITAKKTLNSIFANISMLHMRFKFMSMSGSGGPKVDGTFDVLSQNASNLEMKKKRKKWVPVNYEVTPSFSQPERFMH